MNGLRSLFSPPHCETCESLVGIGEVLCLACQTQLIDLPESHCVCCAEPFLTKTTQHLCSQCMKNPPAFKKVWSAFLYEGAIIQLLHGVKFGKRPELLSFLAMKSSKTFQAALEEFSPDLLLPVPMNFWRLFLRGFNQSYVLARYLIKYGGVRYPLNFSVKRRYERSQIKKKSKLLRQMRSQAFYLPDPLQVKGLRVLVVDDVLTTGSTVRALSQLLVQAEARQVGVFTLARTPTRY